MVVYFYASAKQVVMQSQSHNKIRCRKCFMHLCVNFCGFRGAHLTTMELQGTWVVALIRDQINAILCHFN